MSSATLAPPAAPDLRTLADVLADAPDGVPLERVFWLGRPATEADQLRFVGGSPKRLVELIDGYLVEKPMGYRESLFAGSLYALLYAFVRPRRLGVSRVRLGREVLV